MARVWQDAALVVLSVSLCVVAIFGPSMSVGPGVFDQTQTYYKSRLGQV